MSTSRVSAPAASLVCTVEKTRWPVREAWMAISAVSRSRISPTMITSGSWRRKLRRPLAKVSSIFGLPAVCEIPWSWYSTGSSMVMMFRSGRLILLMAALRVVVLVEQHGALVEQSHHHPPAEHGGGGGEADVDVPAGQLHPDTPVLGEAILGDVEAAHDLHAGDDRVLEALGRPDHLLQHAVHPEAHADVLLLRLDVDVAGPLLGGAEEQRVDQADDGRLVAGVEEILRLLQLVRDHVQVAGLEIADQLLRLVRGTVVDRVDAVEDGLRRHQDGRDAGPEQKAHAVQRARVERVGDGHQRTRVAVDLDAQGHQPRLL